jgi:hypothetical protein
MMNKVRKREKSETMSLIPRASRGKRNVFCLHYSKCLGMVIEKGWEQWNCDMCRNQSNDAGVREMEWVSESAVAYYELSIKL